MVLEKDRQSLSHLKNYIAGELMDSSSGETIDNFEPATGEFLSKVPRSTAEDVDKAVKSAEKAFASWSQLTALQRANYLRQLADAIDKNSEALLWAETVDNGKPVRLTRNVDIPRCSYNLRFFADAITQYSGESYHTTPDLVNTVIHEPLGVVGCISPWNLPLYSFTWKIAPALAAGNCVIGKPSEVTPVTAYLFSQLCKDILPPGVLNILHGLGSEVGEAICQHPSIRAVSFTGSTATGQRIAQTCAPHFKKVALEMGGKNPTVVFADADVDKAVEGALRAAFTNQGQVCLCGSRILIEESLYDEFKEKLVSKAKEIKNGDPLLYETEQGAVVSQAHYEKILSYLSLAKEEGGKVLCGGEAARVEGRCAEGWFVSPTLIEGLPNTCRTNQEEIFGPVATLQKFSGEKQAVELANETDYGLSASVWTENLSRAHRVSKNIQAGTVWVNTWMARDLRTPFGGTKKSGAGREGGLEALHFFTEEKTISTLYDGELR